MTNLCKDCKYFVESKALYKCNHSSNVADESYPVYGKLASLSMYVKKFRIEFCKGDYFEPKPEKKPWWKFW